MVYAIMASSGQLQQVLKTVHYVAPFVVFTYYLAASMWSVCMMQTAPVVLRKKFHNVILSLTLALFITYVAESAAIISQIFSESGVFATQDANVYAISGALVSAVLYASSYESEEHRWYPFWGAWALMLVADAVTITLTLIVEKPKTVGEISQVTLSFARIFVLLSLLTTLFTLSDTSEPATDEETQPLLQETQEHTEQSLAADDPDESTVEAFADSAMAKREQKEKEQLDRLQARVASEGNWLNYAAGFSTFLPYIWPTKRPRLLLNIWGVAICLLGERALNILVPRQLGFIVDGLSAGESHASFVALGFYVLFGWLNSNAGVGGLRSALWVPVESNARKSLETASYNHIMELSCDFHDEKQQGELFASMRQGSSIVELLETLLYELLPVAADLVLALGYFYLLFDSYLVLIGIATMIAYVWFSVYWASAQVKLQRKNNASSRKQYQYLYDSMGDWRTVVYFNQIPYAEKMYALSVSLSQRLWTKLANVMYLGFGIQSLILDIGMYAALILAAYQVLYGGKSIGSFMTLVSYWGGFTGPLSTLASTHKHLLDDLVDAEELLDLFRKEPTVKDGLNELNITNAEVTFEDVKFMYDGKKDIINGFNMKAEPGKTIALIGETGAGKSTIIKLLFRFYDPTAGCIKIDGQDIRNVTLHSLRQHIGMVPQDPSLFNESIMTNLRYAKLNATDEEVFEACKAAAIHDQILSFADGYESVVGERGVKLSGGELQRIAIARAILKNPKIILLDEATSSVDNETEAKIQEGLKILCKGRTTFVIAHRLSTILESDMIIVVEKGRILEQGTPASLLKSHGKFYCLWSKQIGVADAMLKHQESEAAQKDQRHEEQDASNPQNDGIFTNPEPSSQTDTKSFNGTIVQHNIKAPSRTKASFRPEAPEFFPSQELVSDPADIGNPLPLLSVLPGNTQGAVAKDTDPVKKSCAFRNKPKPQDIPSSKYEAPKAVNKTSTKENAVTPDPQNRRMNYRRKSSRSEALEMDRSASLGHDATKNTENQHPSAENRHVSAPNTLSALRADRLMRQDNWRAGGGSANTDSTTNSTPMSEDWSSEGGDGSSQPTPNLSTPGEDA